MTSDESYASAVERVQKGLTPIEIIYSSHSQWPLTPYAFDNSHTPNLKISVLDSSFNPPTLAHLALLNAPSPLPNEEYHAKLLLLSVKNADKTLKPSDATYTQRLDMMVLLAKSVVHHDHNSESTKNTAVAIIDEPIFVRKSSTLLSFLRKHISSLSPSPPTPTITLTFLLGLDTLTRLLTPSYYHPNPMLDTLRSFFSSPPHGDGSRVVCAHRVVPTKSIPADEDEVKTKLSLAKEFIDSGSITLINLPASEVGLGLDLETLSSSEIRDKVNKEDKGWKDMVTESVGQYIVERGLYVSL